MVNLQISTHTCFNSQETNTQFIETQGKEISVHISKNNQETNTQNILMKNIQISAVLNVNNQQTNTDKPILIDQLVSTNLFFNNQECNTEIVKTSTKQISTNPKMTKQTQTLPIRCLQINSQTQKMQTKNNYCNTEPFVMDCHVQTIQQTLVSNKNIQTQHYLMKVNNNRKPNISLNSLGCFYSSIKNHGKKQVNQVKNNLSSSTYKKMIQIQNIDENEYPFSFTPSRNKTQDRKVMFKSPMFQQCFTQQYPLHKLKMFTSSPTSNNDQECKDDKENLVDLQMQQYQQQQSCIIMQKVFSKIAPNGIIFQQQIKEGQKIQNWKKEKFYFISAENQQHEIQKLILWRKGLVCLSTGKMLKLKYKGTISENRGMFILGNSEVIASGSQIRVRHKTKNQLSGDIPNHKWKVITCEVYSSK